MTQDPKIPQEATPDLAIDLSNQFLMAMPGMVGGELAGTVIYVCEHGPKGALGLVINRPTDLSLSSLLEKIDLKLEISPFQTNTVFFGGPVQTDRGFVLHTPLGEYSSSIKLGKLALTTSRDVLQEVAAGKGPEKLFVTLGYAGWGAGQLENELAQNAWLNVAADTDIIFSTPPEQRYPAALKLLGIDPIMLTGAAGHA
jgi:putative transcriptional regulator